MSHWFQRRHRRTSRRKQPQHKDDEVEKEAESDSVATTITTTSSSYCGGSPPDSRTMQHLPSASFSHRRPQLQQKQQQQTQQQPLHASFDHDRNSHRRHGMAVTDHTDMKKNRAVYVKTGNDLYNDIEYYEYTIPSFQRQVTQQPAISSSFPQQQQERSSSPASPIAASSLSSSLSSGCSSSYTDDASAAEGIWNHPDDNRSKRILSEFALSAYLTADCS